MKSIIKQVIKSLPYCGKLIREKEKMLYPPGHFYSPYPAIEEIKSREKEIFDSFLKDIPGVNLNESEQLALFNELKQYYADLSFDDTNEDLRCFFREHVRGYGYWDGIILYCMIRHLKPKKIIEVGCGTSSCVILDTNELFFNDSISCTFIEPYPKRFYSLIKVSDRETINLLPKRLQEVELDNFAQLEPNDILFIDSTHVSKVNSDVNFIFFEILPQLNSGVYIHFHDIFYPFEYPKKWIYSGMAWNEDYILRAFLQYNNAFEIIFFNSFLSHFHEDKFKAAMPLCLKTMPASIWIKKV